MTTSTLPAQQRFSWRTLLQQYGLVLSLVVLCLALSLVSDRFLTVENLTNVLRQSSINAIISVGMMMVILTRGIDLSVGSVLALSTVVAADLLQSQELAPLLAIGVAIGVGTAVGLLNGALVAWVKIPPFIATLGTMTFARGAALAYTGGQPVTGLGELGEGFRLLGSGVVMGVPVPVIVMLVVYSAAYILLNHTGAGRYIQGIGDNEEAAFLSGLPVTQILFFVYALAGALTGLAGVILAGRLNSAQPTAGGFYELDAIAAVVVGGTSFEGGQGTVFGTLIGVLLIAVINNGMNLLDFPAEMQAIAKGVVIVLALLIYRQLKSSN
jgi:ribose transport system permease protein